MQTILRRVRCRTISRKTDHGVDYRKRKLVVVQQLEKPHLSGEVQSLRRIQRRCLLIRVSAPGWGVLNLPPYPNTRVF